MKIKIFTFCLLYFAFTVLAPALPTIEDEIIPEKWKLLGPFLVGSREGIAGVIFPEDYTPCRHGFNRATPEQDKYSSILSTDAYVIWQDVEPDENGNLFFEWDINWDPIQDVYGIAGVMAKGYAYTEIKVKKDCRAIVVANRLGGFSINKVPYAGDSYGHGIVKTPVLLTKGKNKIWASVRATGSTRFTFKILPVQDDIFIVKNDITVPDIIRDEKLESYIGLPIVNTLEHDIGKVKVEISENDNFQHAQTIIQNIPKLTTIKVPLQIETKRTYNSGATVAFSIKVTCRDISLSEEYFLEVKDLTVPVRKTFISKLDGSCQYYAVYYPVNYNPDKKYSLIYALHGASVEAIGLTGAYRQKDWAFMVCPTNRRRFGFDWQDWGMKDAMEILEMVMNKYPIDKDRVCLTGHSMGGHGTWHIGTTHPDMFSCIAPSAGWTSFQLYIPWFLQRSYFFTRPEILSIRDRVLREDRTLPFVKNLLNTPVMIVHGQIDDNVPVYHARIMNQVLVNLNYHVQYWEVEGMKHWWRFEGSDVTDCVDNEKIINFFRSNKRDPYPKKVYFKTVNLNANNDLYWLRINSQFEPFTDTVIEAKVKGKIFKLKTENVQSFSVLLSKKLVRKGKVTFEIDSDKVGFYYDKQKEVNFVRLNSSWNICTLTEKGYSVETESYKKKDIDNKGKKLSSSTFIAGSLNRFPGGIKNAYMSPFVLVYGTQGTDKQTETTFNQAKMQGYRWWINANGFVNIVRDYEIDRDIVNNYNLILFGNSKTNSYLKKIEEKLPIQIKDGEIFLKHKKVDGKCAVFIYPNPDNQDKYILVFEGIDEKAQKSATSYSTLYSGAGIPDYVIFNPDTEKTGWASVTDCGFLKLN